MSRSYNARRKAKRQQARSQRVGEPGAGFPRPRRLTALVPVVTIVGILAIVGIVGFGGSSGVDREQVQQEVTALLSGIPQHGPTLGSPEAPITLLLFADLECPTVKRFVSVYLPSIIKRWVRGGTVKLEYRSLQTDTYAERTFYEQEAAALAAGRQNKLWNYALTFIHEQGQKQTKYATGRFLADIASQVPNLDQPRWQKERKNPLLSRQVARELHSAHTKELKYTPSLLLRFGTDSGVSGPSQSVREKVEASLGATVTALTNEASGDFPTLGFFGAQEQSLGEIGAR